MDRQQLLWLFFGFSGRVSRAAYFLATLLVNLPAIYLAYRLVQLPEGAEVGGGWLAFFWIYGLASVWAQLALAAKRLHDFDKPGMFAITLFIPIFSFLVFLVLCLYPGNDDPNRYGEHTNEPR